MLSNKRGIVTGGSDGIGLGIARAFAQNNANLLLIARNEEKLKESAAAISHNGGKIDVLPADLSDAAALRKAAQDIIDEWPEVDVPVNNAGIARFNPYDEPCARIGRPIS
jgi:short-subunit dehydrogenase